MMQSAKYQTKRYSILAWGKIRRYFQSNFMKKSVDRQIAMRQGNCAQCAACCRLVYRCPWLSEDNLCTVYHSAVRPKACARFPINKRDIKDVELASGTKCGYSFPD